MNTEAHMLRAIENASLGACSERSTDSLHPEIVLLISNQAFCRLSCRRTGPPQAKVVDDHVVQISPSPGVRNGFKFTCSTPEAAAAIAIAIQHLIDGEYPYLFDKP